MSYGKEKLITDRLCYRISGNTLFCFFLLLFIGMGCTSKKEEDPKSQWDAELIIEYNKFFIVQDSLILAKKFEDALNSLTIKSKTYADLKDWKGWFYTQNKIAFVLHRLRKFDTSQTILDSTRSIFLKSDTSQFLLASNYLFTAQTLSFRQKAKEALDTLQKAWYLFSTNRDTLNMVRCLRVEGDVLNFNMSNTRHAKEKYEMAMPLITKMKAAPSEELALLYYGLASCLSKRGDFEMANFYAEKGKQLLDNHKSLLISQSAFRDAIALINYRSQNYDRAIANYLEIINDGESMPTKSSLVHVYINLSAAFIEMREFGKANQYYHRALKLVDEQTEEKALCYLGLGKLYEKMANQDSAFHFLKRALNIRINLMGEKNYRTGISYQYIAQMFFRFGQVDSALFYFQRSIVSHVDSFQSTDIFQSPTIKPEDLKYGLLSALTDKAQALLQKYYLSNDIRFAKAAIEINRQSNDLAFQQLQEIVGRDSHLLLNSHIQGHLKGSLFSISILNDIEKNERYVSEAFKTMEMSKASLLLKSIGMAQSRTKVNEQDSLIVRLHQVLDSLKYYNNSVNIMPLNVKVENFKVEQTRIESTIQKKYPSLYKLKYTTGAATVREVQDYLKTRNALLVEYAFVDSAVFYCIISPDTAILLKTKNDADLSDNIKSMMSMTRQAGAGNHQKFKSIGFELYKKILGPALENPLFKNIEQVIIIPDGSLCYLPFEALCTDSLGNGFRDIHYLIKSKKVSYGFSATSLLIPQGESEDVIKGVLGFSDNASLKGAFDELKKIESTYDGKFLTNEMATEGNFKRYAGQYQILHLGIHGEADPENTPIPYLKFSFKDAANDGILYDYEIYGSTIHANLAVLPACETGLGDYMNGEGVLSIARAFAYAGCPVMISSLWKVNDRTTSTIITGFYDRILNDEEPHVALHNSKIDYLEKSDEFLSHPTYWAGMVAIGQAHKVQSTNILWLMLAIGCLALLTALFVYKQFTVAK